MENETFSDIYFFQFILINLILFSVYRHSLYQRMLLFSFAWIYDIVSVSENILF